MCHAQYWIFHQEYIAVSTRYIACMFCLRWRPRHHDFITLMADLLLASMARPLRMWPPQPPEAVVISRYLHCIVFLRDNDTFSPHHYMMRMRIYSALTYFIKRFISIFLSCFSKLLTPYLLPLAFIGREKGAFKCKCLQTAW